MLFLIGKLLWVKFNGKVLVNIDLVMDGFFFDIFEEWFGEFFRMVDLIVNDEVKFCISIL